MIDINAISLDFFTSRLAAHNPFQFTRFGDGEFQCILGEGVENCDHSTYFPDLGRALAQTLTEPRRDPSYLYALGPKAARSKDLGARVTRWIEEYASDIHWHDSEVFLRASLLGELMPFIRALNRRRVLLVGGAHLQRLPVLNPVGHVIVPDVNAWLTNAQIAGDILRIAHPTNGNRRADVILFCAGMTSKVLIWRLAPILGPDYTLCDCGSVFDLYCGVDSRRYARRMKAERKQELLARNFFKVFEDYPRA